MTAQRAVAEADTPQLRARVVGGDPDAVSYMFELYQPMLLRYLTRWCGGDRVLAEDLAQDTWRRALSSLATWHEQGRPFGAWLVTIARNIRADHFKLPRNARPVDDERLMLMVDGRQSERETFQQAVAEPADSVVVARVRQATLRRVLAAAVARLTPEQRDVMQLRYLDELSIEETARKLGTNGSVVKARAWRAMRTLARNPQLRQLYVAWIGEGVDG